MHRLIVIVTLLLLPAMGYAQDRIVLQTGTLLDGTGKILHNQQIVIESGKISSIGPGKARADYDLSALTVMPGWIDTHIHLQWHMNAEAKAVADNKDPQEMLLYSEADAWMTLQGGFTTVQSVGSSWDAPVRDRIKEGALPGPRVLTSLTQIQAGTGEGDQRHVFTVEELRAMVRKAKADGADVIKLFATSGLGAGGGQTMSNEQIEAVCSEAKAVGLRAVVHAIGDSGARAAVDAGCSSIEHGTFVSDATLDAMAKRGTWFDPNMLVLHNYLDKRESYNFTDAQLATIEKGIAPTADVLHRARQHGVKLVFGTDAVAGAHGRNAEEFIYRVRDAQEKPMDVIISATSLSAECLGLGRETGTLAPGYDADIVGIAGDPLQDITAVRKVMFVMKGGKIYKNQTR